MEQVNTRMSKELISRIIECAWQSRKTKSEFIRYATERLCKEIESDSKSIQGK